MQTSHVNSDLMKQEDVAALNRVYRKISVKEHNGFTKCILRMPHVQMCHVMEWRDTEVLGESVQDACCAHHTYCFF